MVVKKLIVTKDSGDNDGMLLPHFNGISVSMESTLPIIKDYKDYLSSAIVIILLSNKLFNASQTAFIFDFINMEIETIFFS